MYCCLLLRRSSWLCRTSCLRSVPALSSCYLSSFINCVLTFSSQPASESLDIYDAWTCLPMPSFALSSFRSRCIYLFICSLHQGTLTLSPECQSALMSKITNDASTWSATGCFKAVPVWQQWVSKG